MPEVSLHNQGILSREQKQNIVLAILGHDTWTSGTHKFEDGSAIAKLLASMKLQPQAYLCIKPEITVYRSDVPYPYHQITIDVSRFPEGNPQCEHVMIELYWEVGGGGMDSGVPYRYVMCNKCGHHKTEAPLKAWWTQIRRKAQHLTLS